VATEATTVSSTRTGGSSHSPGRSTNSSSASTIFCPRVRTGPPGSSAIASAHCTSAAYSALASGSVHTTVSAAIPSARSGRREMPRSSSALASRRAAAPAARWATTLRALSPSCAGEVTRCRRLIQASRSASISARRAASAIGATLSSRCHRCPPCSSPASSAASVPGSRVTSVSDRASSAWAACWVRFSAIANSGVAHSDTGRSTSARAAHRSALIAPRSPCCRSALAGRVAAKSAIARARTAVCRAISRSAACTTPSGPAAHPTVGAAAAAPRVPVRPTPSPTCSITCSSGGVCKPNCSSGS
jgi:hypothetical protein